MFLRLRKSSLVPGGLGRRGSPVSFADAGYELAIASLATVVQKDIPPVGN